MPSRGTGMLLYCSTLLSLSLKLSVQICFLIVIFTKQSETDDKYLIVTVSAKTSLVCTKI